MRTENRHDYSLEPPEITVLDVLVKNGYETTRIGKIKDIFAGRGITHHIPSGNNNEGIRKIMRPSILIAGDWCLPTLGF